MAKEITLYWGISDWTVESLINQLEEYKKEKVTLRVNSPGGSVFAAYGLYAKILEHGDVHVKIDGMAASAASYLPIYAKSAECLNVSLGMLHRASMNGSDKDLTPEQQMLLDKTNKDLRTQLEKKVKAEVFKTVTGKTIDELFDMEGRLNIWLDADKMKALGYVSKINQLTPEIEQRLAHGSMDWANQIAASFEGAPEKTKTKENMTLDKFKSEHPELYASIVKDSVERERDRVGAWLAYMSIDAKKVQEGIESGKDLSQKAMAEFQVTSMSAEHLAKLKGDSAPDLKITKKDKPEGETSANVDLDDFEASLDKTLGKKQDKK